MENSLQANTANTITDAWQLYNDLQKAIHHSMRLFLVIGKILAIFEDKKLYLALGNGGYDTFSDFLQDPEFGLKKSTLRQYLNVYRYYIQQLQIDEDDLVKIPVNRLVTCIAKLRTQPNEQSKEYIQEIGPLTHKDYVIKSREEGIILFDKPNIIRDDETGKWVIEAKNDQILKIIIDSALILDNSIK